MSGRSPAYVPTTSSRVRSTSIVALTVSSSRSTSQPAADGSLGRALDTARRSCRSASGRATARGTRPCPGRGWSVRSCSGSARAARRGGRRGWAGCASSRRGTGGRARPPTRRSRRRPRGSGSRAPLPVARSSATSAAMHPDRAVGPKAGRADPGDRHGAGGDRGPSHGQRVARVVLDPVVVEQAAAQAVRRRVGASSSVAAFDRRRCQPPSCRAPRMSYRVSPAS